MNSRMPRRFSGESAFFLGGCSSDKGGEFLCGRRRELDVFHAGGAGECGPTGLIEGGGGEG